MYSSIFDDIYNHILNLDNDIKNKDLETKIGKKLITIYAAVNDEQLQENIEKTFYESEHQRKHLKEIFLKFLENVYSIGNKSKLFDDYTQSKDIDSFFKCIILPDNFCP